MKQLLVHGVQGTDVPTPGLYDLDKLLATARWACATCCCESHCRVCHAVDDQPDSSLLSSLLSRMSVEPAPFLALPPTLHAAEIHGDVVEDVQAGTGCECSLTNILGSLSLNFD